MPTIKINLNYSQIDEVAKSVSYLKHVPTVNIDHPNFDFGSHDFELRVRDRVFLKEVEISEKDFERCIDCFEKIAFMYRDTQPTFVAQKFYQHCDENLRIIKRATIENMVTNFWKKHRIEQKWHVFLRKFWENPDYNEPDLSAAFRKRSEKEKIKTRPKLEIHQKKLKKGEKAKEETIKYILRGVLPDLWTREAHKQALDRVADAKFDLRYEAMCKERGVQSKVTIEKMTIQ